MAHPFHPLLPSGMLAFLLLAPGVAAAQFTNAAEVSAAPQAIPSAPASPSAGAGLSSVGNAFTAASKDLIEKAMQLNKAKEQMEKGQQTLNQGKQVADTLRPGADGGPAVPTQATAMPSQNSSIMSATRVSTDGAGAASSNQTLATSAAQNVGGTRGMSLDLAGGILNTTGKGLGQLPLADQPGLSALLNNDLQIVQKAQQAQKDGSDFTMKDAQAAKIPAVRQALELSVQAAQTQTELQTDASRLGIESNGLTTIAQKTADAAGNLGALGKDAQADGAAADPKSITAADPLLSPGPASTAGENLATGLGMVPSSADLFAASGSAFESAGKTKADEALSSFPSDRNLSAMLGGENTFKHSRLRDLLKKKLAAADGKNAAALTEAELNETGKKHLLPEDLLAEAQALQAAGETASGAPGFRMPASETEAAVAEHLKELGQARDQQAGILSAESPSLFQRVHSAAERQQKSWK